MRKIRGLLIDVRARTAEVTEVEDDFRALQNAIGCDVFDIVTRRIGGENYAIVCDDEALLKDEPLASAVCVRGRSLDPALFGSLFIAHADAGDSGELLGLTTEEEALVCSRVTDCWEVREGGTMTKRPVVLFDPGQQICF